MVFISFRIFIRNSWFNSLLDYLHWRPIWFGKIRLRMQFNALSWASSKSQTLSATYISFYQLQNKLQQLLMGIETLYDAKQVQLNRKLNQREAALQRYRKRIASFTLLSFTLPIMPIMPSFTLLRHERCSLCRVILSQRHAMVYNVFYTPLKDVSIQMLTLQLPFIFWITLLQSIQ